VVSLIPHEMLSFSKFSSFRRLDVAIRKKTNKTGNENQEVLI